MEKRVFKETLPPSYKIAYVIIAALCVICAWHRLILYAIPTAVILLLITDRLIKGEYTLESQVIIMQRGRFLRDKTLLIANIEKVEKRKGFDTFLGNVSLKYMGRTYILNPENPDSFTDCLNKRIEAAKAAGRQNTYIDKDNTNNQ